MIDNLVKIGVYNPDIIHTLLIVDRASEPYPTTVHTFMHYNTLLYFQPDFKTRRSTVSIYRTFMSSPTMHFLVEMVEIIGYLSNIYT